MAWQTDEYGESHEGWVGAVLPDGAEPEQVYIDVGSGTNGCSTREWWAYTGRWGRPRAAGYRAACACGWRGASHAVDWAAIGEDGLDDLDLVPPYNEWADHIDAVDRQTVPLPDELAETMSRLATQLTLLADQAPVAALRAVGELERLTHGIARDAAHAAEADELPTDAISKALGLSPAATRSRLLGYRLRG
ncbi:hypothetical protein ACGFZL_19880 [Streptomyces sp. NPDC048182]|uniref:hypothetical protein n=1 Tax=unclassified Streptomyces TaxID=2593676 RepID=UPI0033AE02C2